MAKSMVEVDEGSHQAAMQNADYADHDPGAELIAAMTKAMSVQSTDLGDNMKSLAPAGMLQQASHPDPEDPPNEPGQDTINLMRQTTRQQEKGLPPIMEDNDCHKLDGSDIDDDDYENYENPNHGLDCENDYDGGNASGSDQDQNLSPFKTAREFGITWKTAEFLGFRNLSDAEHIVPALRLDLNTATSEEVEGALEAGLSKLEEKYGKMEPETIYKLQFGVLKIRHQMLLAQQKREEVWCHITNRDPQHVCTEPEMRLSLQEVKFWMRHLRAQFEAEESQVRVQKSLHICKDLDLYYTKGIC